MRIRWSLFLFLGLLFFCEQVEAQERFAFESNLNYDQAIPSPAGFLGYELGDHFTLHADVLDYFEALAASSRPWAGSSR